MSRKLLLVTSALLVFQTGAMAGEGWQLAGSQGVMNMVLIEKAKQADQDTYRVAVAELCGVQPICQVLFWTEGADAPRRLPMTDEQVNSQVAHWQYNKNTGLRRWFWSCDLFPQTPRGDCLH